MNSKIERKLQDEIAELKIQMRTLQRFLAVQPLNEMQTSAYGKQGQVASRIPIQGNTYYLDVDGNAFLKDVKALGDIYSEAWTDYGLTSTITGWSAFTSQNIWYKVVGNIVFVSFRIGGTSSTTTARFTLPYSANANWPSSGASSAVYGTDNGTPLTTPGRLQISGSGNTAFIFSDFASGVWTNSGTKLIVGEFWYWK
jgi:hypothetical protein